MLYLVNAAEDPADAGYLAPELAILAWMKKPVLVLAQPDGAPRMPTSDIARWRRALVAYAAGARRDRVRRVRALLGAGVRAVRRDRRHAARRAEARVRPARRRVAGAAPGAVRRVDGGARAGRRVRRVRARRGAAHRRCCARSARRSGLGDDPAKGEDARAAQALASDASARMREAMDALIALHGLDRPRGRGRRGALRTATSRAKARSTKARPRRWAACSPAR